MRNVPDSYDDYYFIGPGSFVDGMIAVSYTHLRAHETVLDLVCRLLLEKKKQETQLAEISISHYLQQYL